MYLGPAMTFQAANVVKNRTDMFTILASRVMEGQQTEKQNYDTGGKRVNWQPQVLLVCLIATQIVTQTFRKIRLLTACSTSRNTRTSRNITEHSGTPQKPSMLSRIGLSELWI